MGVVNMLKSNIESKHIYQKLLEFRPMSVTCIKREVISFRPCLENTLNVWLANTFHLMLGSSGEGTDITVGDYGTATPCYVSDFDSMTVLHFVQVIDEGDALPQRFDDYMYLQAERGEHTTEGFRKLRVIHRPQPYVLRPAVLVEHYKHIINTSIENGYISSSNFLAKCVDQSTKTGVGTQGPSQTIERNGRTHDVVRCFHVKTWPKEAEAWCTRPAQWPDKQLKSKIKKIGHLLVATGYSKSPEHDLEWRCSFSLAEKILFQAMTELQRSTFVILKALLKEHLPSDINTDGEKQVLTTYHIKTLFLWNLESCRYKWEPENMLDIIGFMLIILMRLIHRNCVPHYFIPSVNLLGGMRLDNRGKSLIRVISHIRNDLVNKIKQLQLFTDQENNLFLDSNLMVNDLERWRFGIRIHHILMKCLTGRLQNAMHNHVSDITFFFLKKVHFSNSIYLMLIESLISIFLIYHKDPEMQYLYRALYTNPIHDTLLTEVVPGLMEQYRGCMHLAKYCMAARDGRVLPDELHRAESLLKNTLHLDPCSGYVKLACLYVATGNFVQAMKTLHVGEKNLLCIQERMKTFVKLDRISAETITLVIHKVFQKWVEGQASFNIVVTWPEYQVVPDFFQFELIHESSEQVTYVPSKMVGLDFHLQWSPLSMIRLLKFICAFNLSQSSSHVENLVADLIASSLSVSVFPDLNDNDIYTVFNMAAWCYVKIKKYKPATRMMTVAIGTSSQTDSINRCAFSYHFLAYVIEECNVWPKEVESWFTRETHWPDRKHKTF